MVKQRKLFMSGRSLDPNIKLGAKLPLPRTEQGPSTDADITPQDFEKMRREVALLGALAALLFCHWPVLVSYWSSTEQY